MSFIQMTGIDQASEPQPMPEAEYRMMVLGPGVLDEIGQNKTPALVFKLGFIEHPEAQNVRLTIWMPKPDDDAQKRNFKTLMLRRFLEAFQIPYDANGFNPEDAAGAEATVLVKLGEPNEQNMQYNEIVLPKLPNEGTRIVG